MNRAPMSLVGATAGKQKTPTWNGSTASYNQELQL